MNGRDRPPATGGIGRGRNIFVGYQQPFHPNTSQPSYANQINQAGYNNNVTNYGSAFGLDGTSMTNFDVHNQFGMVSSFQFPPGQLGHVTGDSYHNSSIPASTGGYGRGVFRGSLGSIGSGQAIGPGTQVIPTIPGRAIAIGISIGRGIGRGSPVNAKPVSSSADSASVNGPNLADSGFGSGNSIGTSGGDSVDGGQRNPGPGRKCYKCGNTNHIAKYCTSSDDTTRKPSLSYMPKEVPMEELWKQHITAGSNFDRYYDIPVEVTGHYANIEPIKSFEECGLPALLMESIKRAKFHTPTPIQQYSIPYVLNGRDIMACAQTGSGKTAAYLLPILTKCISSMFDTIPNTRQDPVVIIVGPTRELTKQVKDEVRKFGSGTRAKMVAIYGGTSVMGQRNELQRGCNILVAAPGRLLHFIDQGWIGLSKCRFLVLDEADKMLDMGFESDMRKLIHQSDMPPKTERQTLMFSATFPVEIQQLAVDFLNDHIFITVGKLGGANTDIIQEIILVENQYDKREKAIDFIANLMNSAKYQDGVFHKKALVFLQRKRMVDLIANRLCEESISATSLHGDRLQEQREEVLEQFKSGMCPVMVATDVAARGLDIPQVDHVINFDMPRDITDYVHRIGRTARIGNTGRATSFFDPASDLPIASDLLKVLTDAHQNVPEWLVKLTGGGLFEFGNTETSFNDGFGSKDETAW